MSNGVGEGGRAQSREKRKLFQANDFAYAIARMAVAQICESVEVNVYQESQTTREGLRFSSFQESTLDKLASVAVEYVQSIGKTAQLYANVAGRVEGNSLDVVQALEDLGSGVGFAGVSDTDRCLADSSVVKDVIRYTGEAEEVPFVYALPRFPVNKEKRLAPSFFEVGVDPPDEHIPVWLPAFPGTKSCNLSEEANAVAIEGEVQHSFNGGGRSEVLQSPNDVRKSTEEVEGNPFLTAPLRFVKKEVSPLFRPLELSIKHFPDKHMSNSHRIPVLEASTPSDDINKENWLAESEDGEKKDGARPQQTLLRFKIGTLKRPSCLAIKRSVQEQGWFQEGGDKWEKKLGTERIDLGTVDSDVK
ncbi:BnaC05g48470D [Brassica napus]|uniref:BnaC05g48470D protein n=1 Tax=Brassica napus TaxID=3708 RepID=A0A078I0Z2_BRANA|nr:BnaC05g48470D [Brassica napus]